MQDPYIKCPQFVWILPIKLIVNNWVILYRSTIAWIFQEYNQTSDISQTRVFNKIVDHSGVVGALPVGAAPTTSSF